MRPMMCPFLAVLLVVLLNAPGAVAETRPDAVVHLLRGYEWSLARVEGAALADDAWRAFLAIARDQRRHNYLRSRAREALTLYPRPEVRAWFAAGIQGNRGAISRRQMAATYCRMFGKTHGAEVETRLMPLLESADPHMRVEVARCLQSTGGSRGRAAVTRFRQGAPMWQLRALEHDGSPP